MAGEKVDRGKPSGERQFAAMHDRAGCHRGLPTATRAFPSEPLSRQFPAPHTAAGRADEPVWPTPLKQMSRACRLVRKRLCELSARHRTIMLPPARHGEHNRNISRYRQAIPLPLRTIPRLTGTKGISRMAIVARAANFTCHPPKYSILKSSICECQEFACSPYELVGSFLVVFESAALPPPLIAAVRM